MKELVKRIVPYGILSRVRSLREYARDRRIYDKYSGPEDAVASAVKRWSVSNRDMQLTKDYHRIEKGLALREPKRPFGSQVAERLDSLMAHKNEEDGTALLSYAGTARAALDSWNTDGTIDDDVSPAIDRRDRGIVDVQKFFASRRSVRDFNLEPVDPSLIETALKLALLTPSVCNRQSWRARVWTSRDDIDRALTFQNGNTGFGSTAQGLILVTVERGLFAGPNERNQVWIEGGLFSMSLVLALHGQGLDTCMLNMSQSAARLKRLHAAYNIPESEAVIMFVAFGHGSQGHRVARSPRRKLSEVVRWMPSATPSAM